MADKVKFRVHCTPLEEITDENSNVHTVISSEVGKTLGGSGEAVVADYAGTAANQGYLNKTVNYLEADDNSNTTDISSEGTASFIYIKNTGHVFSSATALGDPLTASLKVMVGATMVSILDSGEAMIFKDDNRGLNGAATHVRTVTTAGADDNSLGHLAVEYLVVD